MLGVHALVAEDAAHLVHTVHAAHDEALQVQLRLDAEHHVHVQAVVMGVEGTCGRTDLERGQDGGIDLQEALLVQISTNLLQDLAALDKGLLDLGVCDEVNIALTITHLGIGQAVELLGQGAKALGQQDDLLGTGAQLAGLGAEHLTLDADDVAHVQLLESSVSVVAQLVTADVELDVALIVAQMGKACLAHDALGHQTASQCDLLTAVGLVGQILELFLQVSRVSILRELGQSKGVAACSLQVCQLLAAHLHLLALRQALCGVLLLFFHNFLPLGSVCRVGDAQHLVVDGMAGGQQDFGGVADSLLQQGVAHGALVADLAVQGVSLGAAHDVVLLDLVLTLHLDGDVGTDRDVLNAQLALVDDDSVLDHLLQLGDAVLDQTLGVLGLIVLAVLGQVAVAAGFLDLFCQLLAADSLQVFQFLLHCLQASSGHLDLLCHLEISLSIFWGTAECHKT